MASIYKRINRDDDTTFISREVTTGLWTGDTGSIVNFDYSTSQLAKSNSKYFLDIYDVDPDVTSSAEVQFSLAYGNRLGGGSPTLTQEDNSTLSTKAIYLQMKNLLLDPEDDQFIWSDGTTSDQIYVIAVSRARFKGYVDPGNWQLTLSGSNGTFTFIDDSSQTLGTRRSFAKNGLVFNVVSGSISGVSGSVVSNTTGSASGEGFGLFYPQKGIIVLNPNAISLEVGFLGRQTGQVGLLGVGGENTGSASDFMTAANSISSPLAPFTASLEGTGGNYYEQYNWHGLYKSLDLGADFQARSAEVVSSTHYFLRLNNKEFNYSNNPSFATGSNGALTNEDFERDPRVFVTTVGLYNDSNELLAVAKLSRPLEKSFSKEALLRVRLDF